MKLNVDILTPESQVFSGEADEVMVPTVNGQIGILPGHVSLLTQVLPGEIEIKSKGKTQFMAIMGGYLEVNNNQVNILGDYAVRAEDIEIAKAEQAKTKAEKMKKEKLSRQDMIEIESSLRKSLLELKVAKRKRSPRN